MMKKYIGILLALLLGTVIVSGDWNRDQFRHKNYADIDTVVTDTLNAGSVTTNTHYGEWVWTVPGLGSVMYGRHSRAYGDGSAAFFTATTGSVSDTVTLATGSGAIKKINFFLNDSTYNAIDSTHIRIYRDAEATPSIDIPITVLLNSGFNNSASGLDTTQHYDLTIKADHFAVTRNQNRLTTGDDRVFSGYVDLFIPFADSLRFSFFNGGIGTMVIGANITYDHDGGSTIAYDYGRLAHHRTDSTFLSNLTEGSGSVMYDILDVNDKGRGQLHTIYVAFDALSPDESTTNGFNLGYQEGNLYLEIDNRDSSYFASSSIEDFFGWTYYGNGAIWGTDAMGCSHWDQGANTIWYRNFRDSDVVIWEDSIKVRWQKDDGGNFTVDVHWWLRYSTEN